MTANVSSRVIDSGLAVLDTEPDRLFICSQEPTTYAEANSTYRLGQKTFAAGAVFGAPQAGTSNARKVVSVLFTDGTVTATGTATHWAVCDSVNSRLLAVGTLSAPTAVVAAATFGLPSFAIQLSVLMGLAIAPIVCTAIPLATAAPTFGSAILNAGSIATGWNNLKVGAGGLITGINAYPDGTMLCRADTYGGYVYDRTAANPGNAGGVGVWKQLVTKASLAGHAYETKPLANDGCFDLVAAPSNTNVLYMAYHARIFVSSNRGVNWTETGFTSLPNIVGNSGPPRLYLQKMAVDPVNSAVCIFVSPNNGAFITINSGASWTPISGVPVNDANLVGCVVFGKTVSAGRTQNVYISASGSGVYKSTTGGSSGSYTHLASSPADVWDLNISADNTLWSVGGDIQVVNGDPAHIIGTSFVMQGDAFTSKLPNSAPWNASGGGAQWVICHPTDATKLIAVTAISGLGYSSDTGTTWSTPNNLKATINSADIPWLGTLYQPFFTPGALTSPVWDHSDPTKIWCATSQGVFITSLPFPTSPTPLTFNGASSGIEELCGRVVTLPPGSSIPICGASDVGVVIKDLANMDKYPLHQVWDKNSFLSESQDVDWSKTDTTFIAGHVGFQQGGNVVGKSSASGANGTWSKFTGNFPGTNNTLRSGCIAAASNSVMCVIMGHGGDLMYTTNGGANWGLCDVAGVSSQCDGHIQNDYAIGTTVLALENVSGLKVGSYITIAYATVAQITNIAGNNVTIAAPGLVNKGNGWGAQIGDYYYVTTGWGAAFYLTRHNMCCDNSGHFYATNSNPAPIGGVYHSADAINWTQRKAIGFDVGGSVKLRCVPGTVYPTARLFATKGRQGSGSNDANQWPYPEPLYYSSDSGLNWSDASNLTNVGSGNQQTIRDAWAIAIGKEAPGHSAADKAIYIYGTIAAGASPPAAGSAPAVWRTIDNGLTWQQIGPQHPSGWVDAINGMSASLDTYGLVFLTYEGTGFGYGLIT